MERTRKIKEKLFLNKTQKTSLYKRKKYKKQWFERTSEKSSPKEEKIRKTISEHTNRHYTQRATC